MDKRLCLALLWNGGRGCLQCDKKPAQGKQCWKHVRNPAHGLVTGPIPPAKLQSFFHAETADVARVAAGQERKVGRMDWYSRHLMWHFAAELAPKANFLDDLGDADYEACLHKVRLYVAMHRSMQAKLEKGKGPRSLVERRSDAESYNGRDGGRVYKWYSAAVFQNHLARLGASVETCTERQCVKALSFSNTELRKYPIAQAHQTPYAGPQCFPQLKDAASRGPSV